MSDPSVEILLRRATSVANIAMLRDNALPHHIQVEEMNESTSLLELALAYPPSSDTFRTRERILAQLAIHRFVLAPIRRLPVEILSEIFSRMVKATPLRSTQVATTISHVCSAWRKVARGHAALWTRVVVATLRDFDLYCDRYLPLTKGAPLELRCESRENFKDLWDRIAPYAPRWRRIILVGRLSMLPDLKVLYMENLERLVVDAYDAPVSADLSALDFVVAPRLRHVALTLDTLQSERQLHVPVTRALTSLEITAETSFPATLALALLQASADTLQSLTIRIRKVSDGAVGSHIASASGTFTMQALTYLSLSHSACALLDHITAPLLEQIVLSNVPAYGSRAVLGLMAREQASQSLLVLRVYQPEEREISAWKPCLQLMDNLLQLHFDDLLSNGEFLEQLIKNTDRPPLLPSLEGVALSHIFREHPELHEVISEMCGSRRKRAVFRGKKAWQHLVWIRD